MRRYVYIGDFMNENSYTPPKSNINIQAPDKSGAFTSLFDLGYKRSTKQAIAFYFTYLVSLFCLVSITGLITIGIFDASIEISDIIGSNLAVVACTGLAISICIKKSVFKSYRSIGLIVLTLVASLIMGVLLGLFPVSYLTTRDNET